MKYKSVIMRTYRGAPYSGASSIERALLTKWRLKGIALLRVLFGCIWAWNAWLATQPSNLLMHSGTTRQQSFLAIWTSLWSHIMSANPLLFSGFIVLCELIIALGLLLGLYTSRVCLLGILFSLFIWSTAEGSGGLIGQGGGNPGITITSILLFIGLFLSNAGQFYGLDHLRTSQAGFWNSLKTLLHKRNKTLDVADPYLQLPEEYLPETTIVQQMSTPSPLTVQPIFPNSQFKGIPGQHSIPI